MTADQEPGRPAPPDPDGGRPAGESPVSRRPVGKRRSGERRPAAIETAAASPAETPPATMTATSGPAGTATTGRTPRPRPSRAGWWRLGLLGVWTIGGSIAVAVLGVPRPESVQGLILGVGPAAPFVFLVAAAVLTVVLFPRAFLSVAAGLAFGVVLGTVLSIVGTSIGAAGAYYVGRRAGRETVVEHEREGGKLARADAWLGDHGFLAVLYARLIPVSPFILVNYACGVSSVRFRDFFWGTLIGSIPTTTVLTALGYSLRDWNSPLILAAGGMTVVLALVGLVVQRIQGRRRSTGPAVTAKA